MKSFRKYLIHIIVIGIVWLGAIWYLFEYLDDYTANGVTFEVPDLNGMQMDEVDSVISAAGLRYVILDSVFMEGVDKGAVIKQDPKEFTQVKANRNIYITINSMQIQKVGIPMVIDMHIRIARREIESRGLVLDSIKEMHNSCVGCVLKQKYKGRDVKPGMKVNKGSLIELTIGIGESKEIVKIPDLTGLTYDQAKRALAPLNVGVHGIYTGKVETRIDSLRSKVYKQIPPADSSSVTRGSSIDLFLGSKPAGSNDLQDIE